MAIVSSAVAAAAPGYNEAEIRFHVLDPILRALGYAEGQDVYLKLEEKLEYPYVHIGRRSKKDQPLGFPDYRAGLKGARGSFIVEAKAGHVPITDLEVEQAHSYAAHSQVGANYFVLCNGSAISVYETLSGAHARPICEIPLSDVSERFHEIENILSPDRLLQNCHISYDKNLKLAAGLKSSVRIRNGTYSLSDYVYRIFLNGQEKTVFFRKLLPQLSVAEKQIELMKTSFELRVADGIAERGADGRIVAHVKFSGATVHNHRAMQILGVSEATFATADEFISTDPNQPTIFESEKGIAVSKGTIIPQMFGQEAVMEGDVAGSVLIRISMSYNAGKITGQYVVLSVQDLFQPAIGALRLEADFSGTLELIVDV